jgi:hypothetical protein
MRRTRVIACLFAAGLALAVSACGESDPAEGLLSNIDKARNAESISALQTGLVTVGLIQMDSGGAGGDVVAALQAKDPTHRYTTAPPTDKGIIQVTGGAGQPVMLTAIGARADAGRPPFFVSAWQASGTTMYYVGEQPPVYTASAPSGAGWSSTPPL